MVQEKNKARRPYKEPVLRLEMFLHELEYIEIVFACPRGEEEPLYLQIYVKIDGSNSRAVQTSEALSRSLVLKRC